MSDTPETDAEQFAVNPHGLDGGQVVVAVDICRKLERERDEARGWAEAAWAKSDRGEKMLRNAAAKADQWRECAEKLHAAACYLEPALLYDDPEGGFTNEREAVREFMRLKEASK